MLPGKDNISLSYLRNEQFIVQTVEHQFYRIILLVHAITKEK